MEGAAGRDDDDKGGRWLLVYNSNHGSGSLPWLKGEHVAFDSRG
jgi:hypothetical protein